MKLGGEKVADENARLPRAGSVLLQVGKRRFLRLSFQ